MTDLAESLCCGRLMPAWRIAADGICVDCAQWMEGES